MKEPQKLILSSMYDRILAETNLGEHVFYYDGFAMANNLTTIFNLIVNPNTPYLIDDYRIGYIHGGHIRVIINLEDTVIRSGSIVFLKPSTIVEPIEVSPDATVKGFAFQQDMFQMVHVGQAPDVFNSVKRHGIMLIDEKNATLVNALFDVLWRIVKSGCTDRAIAAGVMRSITALYNELFHDYHTSQARMNATNRTFERFIHLVNTHARQNRDLAFYADKLCITTRYLGTLVHQTSGVTAKEWIDRAVISVAKVMLRHTDKQVIQISDELNFSNPSFFCKYFKRLTGVTPNDYRSEKK